MADGVGFPDWAAWSWKPAGSRTDALPDERTVVLTGTPPSPELARTMRRLAVRGLYRSAAGHAIR